MIYEALIDAFKRDFSDIEDCVSFVIAQPDSDAAPVRFSSSYAPAYTPEQDHLADIHVGRNRCLLTTVPSPSGPKDVATVYLDKNIFSFVKQAAYAGIVPLSLRSIDQTNDIQQAFFFHHETAHAITYVRNTHDMRSGLVHVGFENYTESLADAYAAFKIIQAHKGKGIEFVRLWADLRQLAQTDHVNFRHYTTFALDEVVRQSAEIGLGNLTQWSSSALFSLSQTIADDTQIPFEEGFEGIVRLLWPDLSIWREDTDRAANLKRMSDRFQQAVHRRVEIISYCFSEEDRQDMDLFNGPWADARAKYKSVDFRAKYNVNAMGEEDIGKILFRHLRGGPEPETRQERLDKVASFVRQYARGWLVFERTGDDDMLLRVADGIRRYDERLFNVMRKMRIDFGNNRKFGLEFVDGNKARELGELLLEIEEKRRHLYRANRLSAPA